MIRVTYEQSVATFNALARGKAVTGVAFDISFLWHSPNLGTCTTESLSIQERMDQLMAWEARPSTKSVASCHPTAIDLCALLGEGGALATDGWLGPTQSKLTTMDRHVATCGTLCTVIRSVKRCVTRVTNSGHSFVLIRRGDDVEIIDSFAEDRGIGLWALQPDEIDPRKFDVHIPPARRTWALDAICGLLTQLVDADLEKRYAAQLALSNYQYERSDGTADHLPYGPFGFETFALKSDADMFAAVVSRWMHAYSRWQPKGKR